MISVHHKPTSFLMAKYLPPVTHCHGIKYLSRLSCPDAHRCYGTIAVSMVGLWFAMLYLRYYIRQEKV